MESQIKGKILSANVHIKKEKEKQLIGMIVLWHLFFNHIDLCGGGMSGSKES